MCGEDSGRSSTKTIGLQQWTIPKGFYTYEKIDEWNNKKHLSATFERMIKENNGIMDLSRPILEFYKSMNEVRLLVPIEAKKRIQSAEAFCV